jgi:hypothetical protein
MLFLWVPFRDVMGEEEEKEEDGRDGGDTEIDTHDKERSWSCVNRLSVPMHLRLMVEPTRLRVESIAEECLAPCALQSIDHCCRYLNITAFIDLIKSTRDFSRGMGGQCLVCTGFANGEEMAITSTSSCLLDSASFWRK